MANLEECGAESRKVLDEAIGFLVDYSWIYDFSNVRIFKDNRLNFVPEDWMEYLRKVNAIKLKSFFRNESEKVSGVPVPESVRVFREKRVELVNKVKSLIPDKFGQEMTPVPAKASRGMTAKKVHEVERFAQFAAVLASGTDLIVDVGSGLGYLGQNLSGQGFTVCSVERDISHQEAAKKRDGTSRTLHFCLTDSEESRADLNRILFPSIDDGGTTTAVSLHACGDLTPAILKWFCSPDCRLSSIAVVSCCYHKMASFPMSRTLRERLKSVRCRSLKSHFALRLAAQEPYSRWEGLTEKQHEQRSKHLGYRALLECLDSRIRKTRRKGVRKSMMTDFNDFVRSAAERYEVEGMSRNEFVEAMEKLHTTFSGTFMLCELVVGLQQFIQIIMEAVVTLDRLLYLWEQGLDPKPWTIFDEKVSPRCIVISCDRALPSCPEDGF